MTPIRDEGGSSMSTPGGSASSTALKIAHAFDIAAARARLRERGGYEVIHESTGLEIGVNVLVAPEPDRQQPHADDEVYIVLEGRGALEVEHERVELREGQATFVPAGANHQFVGYEQLSVLVIFEKAQQWPPRG
jgi:mannose-6-phosphate isomerase-like protein (cupin superfamily)